MLVSSLPFLTMLGAEEGATQVSFPSHRGSVEAYGKVTSLVVDVSSIGIQADDVVFIVAVGDADAELTLPAGFEWVYKQGSLVEDYGGGVAAKVATGTDASYTVQSSVAGQGISVVVSAWSDVKTSDWSTTPFDTSLFASTEAGASLTLTCPDITTTEAKSIVLRPVIWDRTDVVSRPSGHTLVEDTTDIKDPNEPGCALVYEQMETAGAAGTAVYTLSGSQESLTGSIVLNPGNGVVINTDEIYVDAVSGNDANDGSTQALAIKTIDHLNTLTLDAGAVVAFKRGQIHRTLNAGLVPQAANATQTSPIKFTGYGDQMAAKPIIAGSTDGTALTWTTASGNIWASPAIAGGDQGYIKNLNQIYINTSPAAGFEDTGGISPHGIDCSKFVWDRSWTSIGSNRYTTTINTPKTADDYPENWTYNCLVLNTTLYTGGPETSQAAVTQEGQWYLSGTTLTIYALGDPNNTNDYHAIVLADLSANGHWTVGHDGANHVFFIYHSAGSPASQYTTLELPVTEETFVINHDWVEIENLEIRWGGEGLWLGDSSNASNCTVTNVDIRQVCRNGLQVKGNSNLVTGAWIVENVGSFWFKRPQDTAFDRNGHGVHMADGDFNTFEGFTIRDIGGEDCIQHAENNNVGENNWYKNGTGQTPREDCVDVKDGKPNFEDVHLTAQGDGLVRRNGVLLHENCTGFFMRRGSITTIETGGQGVGDCISRSKTQPRPITLEGVKLKANGRYCIDVKEGQGDVTTTGCVFIGGPNTPIMEMVGGVWTSTNDSFYHPTNGGGTAAIILGHTGTSSFTNLAAQVMSDRIFQLENGAGISMSYSCIHRDDSTSGWVYDNGTARNEAWVDSTFTDMKTEAPGFDNAGADDLTISAGAAAESGGTTSGRPTTDHNGNAWTGTEIGAYSLNS